MKTPEEIKKGLEICAKVGRCSECPYSQQCDEHLINGGDNLPSDAFLLDVFAYVDRLELEREGLMFDLEIVCETLNTCLSCDHYRPDWEKPGCELNGLHCAWKWRGLKEET